MLSSPHQVSSRGRFLLAVAPVLVFAALFRIVGLDRESLWLDEILTLHFVADRSLAAVIADTFRIDYHPFMFYAVLDAWVAAFGSSTFATRLLSVVFGVATVLFVALLGRETAGGRRAGWIAASLASASPTLIWYAQEVRMYAFETMLYAAAIWCLIRLVRGPSFRRALFLVIVVTLFLYSHATAGVATLPLWCSVLAAAAWRGRARSARNVFVFSGISIVALYVPWAVRAAELMSEPKPLGTLDLASAPALFAWLGFRTYVLGPHQIAAGVIAAGLVAIALGAAIPRTRPPRTECLDPTSVRILAAGVLVPLLVTVAVTWSAAIYQPRNLLYVLAPLLALAGSGGAAALRAPAIVRAVVAGATLFVFLAFSLASVRMARHRPQKEDWIRVAAHLDERVSRRDALVIDAGFTLACVDHYRTGPAERAIVFPIDAGAGGLETARVAVEGAEAAVADGNRVWIVFSHARHRPELERSLHAAGFSIHSTLEVRGVEVHEAARSRP